MSLDMLGAEASDTARVERSLLKLGAAGISGVLGAMLWRRHPVLGLLNGIALGSNAMRVATKEISLRESIEHIGAHLVATAASLALPSHPVVGYAAGALSSSLFLNKQDTFIERIEETIVGKPAEKALVKR